ncbi:MAG: glycerophosphodiester phosphodiesterase family protein [Anaerolineae bacterium]
MTPVTLIHAIVFLAFWLTNLPFQETLNNFLTGATGLRANFLLIFIGFAGLVTLWSAARMAVRWDIRRTGPTWLYLATGGFFLLFFYGSFAVLFLKNPVQLYRLGQLLRYFRLIVDAGLLLFLAWSLQRWGTVDGALKNVLIPAGLLILWLIPVFWTPGNVYRGTLPEKPRLFAHRGASTQAPENTLASMQTAVDLGVYGLETDITISADGVLFLMHDDTLARTTDVAQVFPRREDDPVETFTWDELSRLDAGSWFAWRGVFTGEAIPTLEAILHLVKENDLYFIYDLRIPSASHPYTDQALALCLEEIRVAGVTDHTWVLAEPEAIAQIQSVLPGAILAVGIDYTESPPSPASLVADGYWVVNSEYGLSDRRIHAYQNAGLWVNLWVVDEPWQYSRLWLAGADSVTSNNPQDLLSMPHPALAMPYGIYLAVWGLLGWIAALTYWWTSRLH